MHIAPNSKRFSNDLDYFHDSEERVASAFAADRLVLEAAGYAIEVGLNQSGLIRAIVSKAAEATKVEWAHDSAWRFLPPLKDPLVGFVLHPVDLAVNKLLALVGRDEPRDFLDIMYAHTNVLSLGALSWAAAGKDPGFTPTLLLGLLKRRGRVRPEDFAALHLRERPDLHVLYYSTRHQKFVSEIAADDTVVPHYGRPGGGLPAVSA